MAHEAIIIIIIVFFYPSMYFLDSVPVRDLSNRQHSLW